MRFLKYIILIFFISTKLVSYQNQESNKTKQINISITSSFGKYNGLSREVIYQTNGKKLSELFWKTDRASLFGLQFTISGKSAIILGASAKINIGGDAEMDDYDWLCQTDGFSCNSSEWSHHSYSPNTSVEDIRLLKIFAKYKKLYKNFNLFFIAGFRQDYFKWIAQNRGTNFIYTIKNGGGFRDYIAISDKDGPAITYEQTYNTPYIGIEITKNFWQSIISFKLEGSTLVKSKDKDIHHNRDLIFYDKFDTYSNMIDLQLSLDSQIYKNLFLNIKYNYFRYFENSNGYSEIYKNGVYSGRTADKTAGIDNKSSTIELGFKIKL